MRKRLAVAALVAGGLSFGAFGVQADTLPGGVEGCIVSTPGQNVANPGSGLGSGNVVNNGTCSFTATRTGGFVAASNGWVVTVYNNNTAQKVVVNRFTGTQPNCNIAAYVPGNFITVQVTGNGIVAAGNPFPAATDGTIPSNGDSCKR